MRTISRWLRDSLTAIVLLWAIVGPIAQAETISPTIRQDFPFLKFYLRHVFLSVQTDQLLKFDNIADIPIEVQCRDIEHKVCDRSGELVVEGFHQTSNLKFHYSFAPLIRVFLGSLSTVKTLENEAIVVGSSTELTDTSDESCVVVVSVDGSVIKHADIFISTDQSEIRQKTCAVAQVSRAVGLNGSVDFSFLNRWNEAKVLFEDPSNDEYEKYRLNNTTLQYIHYCTLLRAGSTKQQVVEQLSSSQECFKNINLRD